MYLLNCKTYWIALAFFIVEVNHTIEPTEIPNETISDSVDMFEDFSVVLDDDDDLAINKKCNFYILSTIKFINNVESMRWDL